MNDLGFLLSRVLTDTVQYDCKKIKRKTSKTIDKQVAQNISIKFPSIKAELINNIIAK